MRLGEVRAGNDTGNLQVVVVDVCLRNLVIKAGIHHFSLKLSQLLVQVFSIESVFISPLDQGAGSQQQADGALLAINNVFFSTMLVKDDGAKAVRGLALMDRDVGEKLVDVLAGPFVGALILGNDKRRVGKQFLHADDLAGQRSNRHRIRYWNVFGRHTSLVLPVSSSCILLCLS